MKALALATLVLACTPRSRLDPGDRGRPARDGGAADAARDAPVVVDAASSDALALVQPVLGPGPLATVTFAQPHLPPATVIAAAPGRIGVVAATDDGRTAVTSDGGATLRLWPTLDGTREPVLLRTTTAPALLAVVRDKDELVIAAADRAGQLEVLRTSELGVPASRVVLDLGRPIAALVPAASAFVLLRDDQTVVAIDRDAHVIGTLGVGAGEHVASLAARRGRMLAMLATERGALARWITVGDTLAFGDTSPAMAIDPAQVALAPDGKRIAAFTRGHDGLAILDLASGKVATWVVPQTKDMLEAPFVNPFLRGFVDDHTLLYGSEQRRSGWWHDGTIDTDLGPRVPAAIGGSDHHIVLGDGGGLALATPDGRRRLGYRYSTITSAVRAGNGWLVSDGVSVLALDDRFRARKGYELPGGPRWGWANVIAVDPTHVLADENGSLFLLDLADDRQRQQIGSTWGAHYEPATGLLGFDSGGRATLVLRDPRTGAFGQPVEISGKGSLRLQLLDPAVEDGKVAVVLEEASDHTLAITDVRIELHDGTPKLALRTRSHAAVAETASVDAFAALGYSRAVRRANRDRSRIAEIAAGRITLRDATGKVRWTIAVPGASDVAWSQLGDLVVFGSGIARIDADTGALLDRQCGWDFGLLADWEDAVLAAGAQLCEAP